MNPRVSLIVATSGRAAPLEATLRSLRAVHFRSETPMELLVVENGPKAGAEDVARSFRHPFVPCRYFYEPKQGKSLALNRGLAEAKAEILVFFDDDLRFSLRWLDEICSPITAGAAHAVAGRVVVPAALQRPWMSRYHLGWIGGIPYRNPDQPEEIAGANMAVHRSVLSKVPRFDIELGGGALGNCEDTLFSRQLNEAGFSLRCAPHAVVEHHFDPSKLLYAQWVKNAAAAGRSRAYLLHHWLHESISLPQFQTLYLTTKLSARRPWSRRHLPFEEGISAWELSYRFDIAKCRQFKLEKRRPRNYAPRGLTKLSGLR